MGARVPLTRSVAEHELRDESDEQIGERRRIRMRGWQRRPRRQRCVASAAKARLKSGETVACTRNGGGMHGA